MNRNLKQRAEDGERSAEPISRPPFVLPLLSSVFCPPSSPLAAGRLLTLWLALLTGGSARAHEHLAAGASLPEQDVALLFINAANFAADSGYVFRLDAATNGPYAGFHHAEITFVCQPATPDLGGPQPLHPAPGAHVETVLESVEGPVGGSFGFWESPGEEETATELTFSIPVGESQGTRQFPVSQNDGSAGADPYGHIHGRVVSATEPGLYRVGFRFLDTSNNGTGGGPIHLPSVRYYLNFQAGITLAAITNTGAGPELTFAASLGFSYVLEATSSLSAPTMWVPVGEAVPGDNRLHTVAVPPPAGAQFYRLRRDPL